MDSLKCQTSTATPAEPGGLLVLLAADPGLGGLRDPPGQGHTQQSQSSSMGKVAFFGCPYEIVHFVIESTARSEMD